MDRCRRLKLEDMELGPKRALVVKKAIALQSKTAHFIVKDANLDECSEHEMDTLGDSDLFDLIRIELTVLITLRVDDDVVDVEDGNEDVPEHVMAPQVVQGDGSPQAEEAMEERVEPTLTA
nr:hypothetical protein CFP56_59037 [Quercus suber]